MSYWNPKNEKFLYFHVVYGEKSFYLKVNTEQKTIFKLCPESMRTQGKYYIRGVYELKWSTFTSGYLWNLKPTNIKFVKNLELKDGNMRGRTKYTTENQWQKALKLFLESI